MLLAVALLALVLFACLWVWFFIVGPVPKTGVFFHRYPSMFWDFGSLHQKHRQSAGLRVVCVLMDQMVGDRRFPGASILGVEVVYFLRQPSLLGPPTGPEHSDASWCGQCTRWQVVYIQTGSFSLVCSGTSVRSTRGVAASFLTRCRGSRIFLRVAAQASRTAHSRWFCNSRR